MDRFHRRLRVLLPGCIRRCRLRRFPRRESVRIRRRGEHQLLGNAEDLCPLWTATTGGGESSPTVVNGVLYIGSANGKLYAFDAAGNTNCSGTPKVCAPLWTATTGAAIITSPAVANGIVYTSSFDDKLYAYDAAGVTNCSGTPKTCAPLWTAATGGSLWSSPAVANAVVYVGGADDKLYAFDATGTTNCSGTPKTCAPLWTVPPWGHGFYTGGGQRYRLRRCVRQQALCVRCHRGHQLLRYPDHLFPMWTATTGAGVASSPAVANGVVFVGSYDGKLYAYDASGSTDCSGAPKTCAPVWTATTGARILSSPAVANGMVYVGSSDYNFYAFGLPS